MSNINQTGTFRGDVIDRGVSATQNGYPQLIVQLRATEKYDDQNGVWIPWDYEEVDATAYLVLFGKDNKPLLNVRQVMKAFGWDGASFQSLQENPDLAKQIQFRMAESTYEGVTRIKCEWVDAFDADPTRKVQKLDVGDIKKLDAQYAAALKAVGGGPKPKSAKPTAPPQAPVSPDPTSSAAVVATASATTATNTLAVESPKKRGRPKAPPAAPTVVTPPPVAPGSSVAMTQQEAWDAYTAKAAGKTDMEITNTWTGIVHEIGGDEKVGADWSGVYAQCCSKLGV
jgi:hypothetical protein